MSLYSFENPVFVTFAIAAAIMILKLMLQGWVTVAQMLGANAGLLNPEDLIRGPANPNPSPEQLAPNERVERSRRIQRNDLENIPGFLAAGFLFVATAPSLVLTQWLMYGFVGARVVHTIAYSTQQRHEVRATLYTIGSLIVIAIAILVLVAAAEAL